MKKIQLQSKVYKGLADFITPVMAYLKLRDHYSYPVLLESNDFTNKELCFSFLAMEPIISFSVQNQHIRMTTPYGQEQVPITGTNTVVETIYDFVRSVEIHYDQPYPYINGFFGHTNFEAVRHFDTLQFDEQKRVLDLPDMVYHFYRFVLVFNHYKDEFYLVENLVEGATSRMDEVRQRLMSRSYNTFPFVLVGETDSNLTDEEFRQLVRLGKHHCQIGDVFQIVFSRAFRQAFKGDEFAVYRILRSINPSPYLFYFDLGNYKIFGSSPESQMVIRDGKASVNPIAGTYRRSGVLEEDMERAAALHRDPKENAEHIMLVDLARNDLGRHCSQVEVKELKKIHYYSHVMHLVSHVEGTLRADTNPIQVFGDTFPAGTLSGAPKFKAIELIHQHENQQRGFYGGAIGYIDVSGEMNQAILIRSFLSKDHVLHWQAGAGVVVSSVEESELQEVNNKLGALTRALIEATKLI